MQKLAELLDPIRDRIKIKRQMAPPEHYVSETGVTPREFVEPCDCVLIEDRKNPTWTYMVPETEEEVPVRVIKLCDHHMKHPEVMSVGGYVLDRWAEEKLAEFREVPDPRQAEITVDWVKGTRKKPGYFKAKIGRKFCRGESFNEAVQKLVRKVKEEDGTNFDFRVVAGREKRKATVKISLPKPARKDDGWFPWF